MNLNGTVNIVFQLTGENFEPAWINDVIDIKPSRSWNRPELPSWNVLNIFKYSLWEISINETGENIDILKLIEVIVDKLKDKIDVINELKHKYKLESVLEITISTYLADNIRPSTSFELDFKVIEFLFKTKTRNDFVFCAINPITN